MALTPQEKAFWQAARGKFSDEQIALKIKERREAAGVAAYRPGADQTQRLGNIQPQEAGGFVMRGTQPVSVREEQGVDPATRWVVQNFTSGNSDAVANWLRSKGKVVERDDTGRLIISSPTDPTPRVIDPAGFDSQDITDLMADIGVGYATGGASGLVRQFARPIVRGVAGLATFGAAGYGAAETARQGIGQAVTGEPMDPQAIGTGMALTGLAPVVTGTATRIAGRAGSVPQETIRETMNAPMVGKGAAIGMTLPPAAEAEHLLGKELSSSITASRAASKARPEFGPMLQEAAARDVKVDGTRILDRILSRIDDTAVEPSRRAANDRLGQFAENFTDLLEPDGSLQVKKLDRFLRKDVRGRVKDLIGREGGTDYQEALKDVQKFVADELKGSIDKAGISSATGKTAAQVQAGESVKIGTRKRVAAEFTRGVKGVPERPAVSTRIRTLFEPGNESKRDALLAYDNTHGTDFTGKAKRLSFKRDWNPDDRKAAHGLDRVLNIIFIGARPAAKAGAVLTRPLQAATAAFSDAMSRREQPNP